MGSALSDEQIDALYAAAGIVLQPQDRAELRALARFMLQQASLIGGALPYELEPAATFNIFPAGPDDA